MQREAADELHVEVALPQRALGRLPHGGERLVQEVVGRLAVPQPRTELVGQRAQLRVGQRLELRLKVVDVVDHLPPYLLYDSLVGAADKFCEGLKHDAPSLVSWSHEHLPNYGRQHSGDENGQHSSAP